MSGARTRRQGRGWSLRKMQQQVANHHRLRPGGRRLATGPGDRSLRSISTWLTYRPRLCSTWPATLSRPSRMPAVETVFAIALSSDAIAKFRVADLGRARGSSAAGCHNNHRAPARCSRSRFVRVGHASGPFGCGQLLHVDGRDQRRHCVQLKGSQGTESGGGLQSNIPIRVSAWRLRDESQVVAGGADVAPTG